MDNRFDGDAQNVIQARDIIQHYHLAAAEPVTPRMLPPAPWPFVDRESVLTWLNASLADDRSVVALLSGLGGIGKTGVSTRWARDAADRFPGGSLYADLAGLSRRGVTGLSDVLGRFLHALGVGREALPASIEERIDAYRDRTAGQPLLVLLDNAESAAQIADLRPSAPGSLVIVTSDRLLSGVVQRYGARRLTIPPLDAEAGRRLLAEIAGEGRVTGEPEASGRLVDQCGGLPLALRVAGAHLEVRPNWTVAKMVDRLVRHGLTTTEGERPVAAVCDTAYAELPVPAARVYRLLGVHPAGDGALSVRAEAVAALADLPVDDAEEILDVLADRHLLDREQDRYVMRRLIREHARGLPGDVAGAVRRVTEWYLRFAVDADFSVNPYRGPFGPRYAETTTVDRPLDALDAEHANLRAAVHTAYEAGWDDLAWQLCEALWSLYFSRKHYDDWIATHRDGLASARRTGDSRAVFRVAIQLGRAYYETRRFPEAHKVLAEAVTAAAGDPLSEATALEFTGRAHFDAATAAADRTRRAEEPTVPAQPVDGIRGAEEPAVLARPGDRTEVPDRERADDRTEVVAEYELAESFLREALRREQEGGRTRGVAIDSHHLARVRLRLGDPATAFTFLARAEALFTEIGDTYNHARTLMTLGEARIATGDPATAFEPLHEALRIMSTEGRTFYEAETLALLADAAARTGDPAAPTYLEAATAAYESVGSPRVTDLKARIPRQRRP